MKQESIVAVGIGAGLGGLISLVHVAFDKGFSTATGLLLALLGVVGAAHAVQAWRRTGLALATGAIAVAAGSLIGGGSAIALGWDPRTNLSTTLALLTALVLITGLLMFVESRLSREKWRRWKEEGGPRNLLDLVTAAHIPYLRER